MDLLLKHGAEVEDGVGEVESRPGDHVEGRVPQPLIRTVLLQPWTVEVVLHAPLLALYQVTIQYTPHVLDQFLLIGSQRGWVAETSTDYRKNNQHPHQYP